MLTKKYKDIVELLVKKLGDNLFKKATKNESLLYSINKSPSIIAKDMIPLSENKVAVENDIVGSILNPKLKMDNDNMLNSINTENNQNTNSSHKKSKGLIDRINTNTQNKSSVADLARIEMPNVKKRK